jgi:hypothetical protein
MVVEVVAVVTMELPVMVVSMVVVVGVDSLVVPTALSGSSGALPLVILVLSPLTLRK